MSVTILVLEAAYWRPDTQSASLFDVCRKVPGGLKVPLNATRPPSAETANGPPIMLPWSCHIRAPPKASTMTAEGHSADVPYEGLPRLHSTKLLSPENQALERSLGLRMVSKAAPNGTTHTQLLWTLTRAR